MLPYRIPHRAGSRRSKDVMFLWLDSSVGALCFTSIPGVETGGWVTIIVGRCGWRVSSAGLSAVRGVCTAGRVDRGVRLCRCSEPSCSWTSSNGGKASQTSLAWRWAEPLPFHAECDPSEERGARRKDSSLVVLFSSVGKIRASRSQSLTTPRAQNLRGELGLVLAWVAVLWAVARWTSIEFAPEESSGQDDTNR